MEDCLVNRSVLVAGVTLLMGMLVVASITATYIAEAKSKKKGYDVRLHLIRDAPTKGKKTLVTLGIENIKNKIVKSHKQDIDPQVADDEEGEFDLNILHVED